MPEPTQDYVPQEYFRGNGAHSRPADYARSIYWYLSSYIKTLFIRFLKFQHLWTWHDVGYYNFGKLYQDDPAFGPFWIIYAKDYSHPHCKCIMYNGLEVDNDHLLRGEVLTALRIMLGQLKLKALVNDMIAPVLLLSMNGEHARILEAWFDGQEAIIRYTTNYDFTTLNLAGYKTFAQWFIGDPLGDTSSAAL